MSPLSALSHMRLAGTRMTWKGWWLAQRGGKQAISSKGAIYLLCHEKKVLPEGNPPQSDKASLKGGRPPEPRGLSEFPGTPQPPGGKVLEVSGEAEFLASDSDTWAGEDGPQTGEGWGETDSSSSEGDQAPGEMHSGAREPSVRSGPRLPASGQTECPDS